MNCPKCTDSSLKETIVKKSNLKIDRCSSCKGLWFDKNEFSEILGTKAVKKLVVPNTALHNPKVKCPSCNNGLYEFFYPGTTTFIDACKSCGGIWLDNQEWKEINAARDISNKISCPKCKKLQNKSDSCVSCGIVFAKYNKINQVSSDSKEAQPMPVLETATPESIPYEYMEQSYADDIPGVKGMMLRFIDRSIAKLY